MITKTYLKLISLSESLKLAEKAGDYKLAQYYTRAIIKLQEANNNAETNKSVKLESNRSNVFKPVSMGVYNKISNISLEL